MKVWDLRACEEYSFQDSLGLFVSIDAARRAVPHHTSIVDGDEDTGIIVALPEHRSEVLTALKTGKSYWWYDLPCHGRHEQHEMTFYGIFPIEVRE